MIALTEVYDKLSVTRDRPRYSYNRSCLRLAVCTWLVGTTSGLCNGGGRCETGCEFCSKLCGLSGKIRCAHVEAAWATSALTLVQELTLATIQTVILTWSARVAREWHQNITDASLVAFGLERVSLAIRVVSECCLRRLLASHCGRLVWQVLSYAAEGPLSVVQDIHWLVPGDVRIGKYHATRLVS
jgi:hypothetical protein